MWGNVVKEKKIVIAFEKIPRISLSCKLVSVQYREYENGLFWKWWDHEYKISLLLWATPYTKIKPAF